MAFDVGDYVDVAARISEFYARYPDGRITRLGEPVVLELPRQAPPEKQKTFVIYTAVAYRTADDPVPSIGTAWEPFPGPTMFTRDSELMNAETAAWGRAIIGTGIPSKKIASREEVLARRSPKPSLEQALNEEEAVETIKEVFDATEIDELSDAGFDGLDLGGQAWVLKTAVGLVVRKDKTAISEARGKLTEAQRSKAADLSKKLLAKKAKA